MKITLGIIVCTLSLGIGMFAGFAEATDESFLEFAKSQGVSVPATASAPITIITTITTATTGTVVNNPSFASFAQSQGIDATGFDSPSPSVQVAAQIQPTPTVVENKITITPTEPDAITSGILATTSLNIDELIQGSVVESFNTESGERELIRLDNDINITQQEEPVLERLDDSAMSITSIVQIIAMIILSLLLIIYIGMTIKQRPVAVTATTVAIGILMLIGLMTLPVLTRAAEVTQVQSSSVEDFKQVEAVFTGGIEDLMRIDLQSQTFGDALTIEPPTINTISKPQDSLIAMIIQSIQDIWARLTSHEIRFKKIEAEIETIKSNQQSGVVPVSNEIHIPTQRVKHSGNALEELL